MVEDVDVEQQVALAIDCRMPFQVSSLPEMDDFLGTSISLLAIVVYYELSFYK